MRVGVSVARGLALALKIPAAGVSTLEALACEARVSHGDKRVLAAIGRRLAAMAIYGIAVFLVMYLVVMPLCAFHFKGPYTLHVLITGIVAHMLLIGLPIGWSLHRWGD